MDGWKEELGGKLLYLDWAEIYVSPDSTTKGKWQFQVFANMGGKQQKNSCKAIKGFNTEIQAKKASIKEAIAMLNAEINKLKKLKVT